MVNSDQILAAFKKINQPIDSLPDVVESFVDLCNGLRLSSEDLATKWDAFSINSGITAPGRDAFTAFRNKVEKESTKPKGNAGHQQQLRFNKSNVHVLEQLAKTFDHGIAKSAAANDVHVSSGTKRPFAAASSTMVASSSSSSSSSVTALPGKIMRVLPSASDQIIHTAESNAEALAKFRSRDSSGKVLSSFQVALERGRAKDDTDPVYAAVKVLHQAVTDDHDCCGERIAPRFLFMSESIRTTTESIVDRLVNIRQQMLVQYDLERFHPLLSLTTGGDAVTVFGRICEGDEEGHELSLEGMNGRRLSLDLSRMRDDYVLFLGQIVGLQGYNPTGKIFLVQKILDKVPAPLKYSLKSEISEIYDKNQGRPVCVVVGCGPYCLSGSTELDPLKSLFSHAKDVHADVVILQGPFADVENDAFSSQRANPSDPAKIMADFGDCINEAKRMLPNTKIVLQSSLRDTFARNCFPQPAIPFHEFSLDPNSVLCVGNPCVLQINEVTIGLTSFDVLLPLSRGVICKNTSMPDRLSKICELLINQRSFYPLFPPADGSMLSMTHYDNINLQISPDILILPSNLQPFAKQLGNSLAVNPGRITKAQSGGTFAQLTIHPLAVAAATTTTTTETTTTETAATETAATAATTTETAATAATEATTTEAKEEEEAEAPKVKQEKENLEMADTMLHRVPERTRVDIVRI